MREKSSCLTTLMVAAVVVAVICSFVIKGGWVMFIPVGLAVATLVAVQRALDRW
jgi:hypothetical protein